MTPEIEIRDLVTNALAVHVPETEIKRLIDDLVLVFARSLDTALFDTRQQARIAAQVELMEQRCSQAMRDLEHHIDFWKAAAETWMKAAHHWQGQAAA